MSDDVADSEKGEFWIDYRDRICSSRGFSVKRVARFRTRLIYEKEDRSVLIPTDGDLVNDLIGFQVWRIPAWEKPEGVPLTEADKDRIRRDLIDAYTFDKWTVLMDDELRKPK